MATSRKQLGKLAENAAFVFIGKVQKLKAATIEELAAENTAIVHVERVLSVPDMFQGIGGHDVTVRLPARTQLARGARKTFFANGWIFGASLAVDVVGAVDETDPGVVGAALREAKGAAADAVVKARLDAAEIGVAGTVSKVTRSAQAGTHISEHDPDWHEATIDVDEVVKGRKGVKQVTVLFPNSDDTRWHNVRKFAPGEQGVFMLQGKSPQSAEGVPAKLLAAVPAGPEVFTTLHPSDYLPLHELERVRALARK